MNICSNMELIILLSLMTALASSASLTSELCDEGESFWCESLANAEVCGAMDHCMETVWRNMHLKEEEGSLSKASHPVKCRACQKFFSFLYSHLETSESKALLLGVLRHEVCPLLTPINTDTCMRAVESLLPWLLKLTLQFHDYTRICQQLTFCAMDEDDVAAYDIHLRLDNHQNTSEKCNGCISALEVIWKLRPDLTSVIEGTLLKNVCKNFEQPFTMLCNGLVKLVAPQIFNDLYNSLVSRNVCSDILRYCHEQESSAYPSLQLLPAKEDPDESTVCQQCIQVFKTTIENDAVNKTDLTLLNAVRQICDSLTWPYRGQCHRMIYAVGRPGLKKLSRRLHPEGVCQMFVFCQKVSNINTIRGNGGMLYVAENGMEMK